MLNNSYLQRWFLFVFAFFCLGINVIAYVLYEKAQKANDTKEWVTHTYNAITAEYKLFSAIQDRQAGARGFIMTGNDDFLDLMARSENNVAQSFEELVVITKDNAEQQNRLQEYRVAIDQLRDLSLQQIGEKKAGNNSVSNGVLTNKKAMDKIRDMHAQVLEHENRLLLTRKEQEDRLKRNYTVTLFTTAGISFIGLLLANGLIAFISVRRKNAEENLLRINKEMEGFTYIASHDLRSPLVNLKGFASEIKYSLGELKPLIDKIPEEDRAKANEILDKDIAESLHFIDSSVTKMDKMTSAILELSRLGRRTLDYKEINVDKAVRHVLDTLHHTITSKNIEVTVMPLPDVYGDPLSVEQIFGNIIDNAIKFMDPARTGKIEIGGTRNYRETRYWIKDNGRGIDSDDFQKIFEIYRRAGNTDHIPGEGMGMAYVRTTLRRMGGQIWVESEKDKGSTFYFTISNALKKEHKK